MQAVEFQVKIKNGMIEISSRYKDKLKDRVRVITLSDEKEMIPTTLRSGHPNTVA